MLFREDVEHERAVVQLKRANVPTNVAAEVVARACDAEVMHDWPPANLDASPEIWDAVLNLDRQWLSAFWHREADPVADRSSYL